MFVGCMDEIWPLVLFACKDKEETAWFGGDIELGDQLEQVGVILPREDAHGDVDARTFSAWGSIRVPIERAGVPLGRG